MLLSVVSFLAAGCKFDTTAKTVPAEGVVTLDGQTVENAVVIFAAEVGSINATAVTGKDGRFELRSFEHKPGAIPGSYKVSVNKTSVKPASSKQGESDVTVSYGLPEKYASLARSGLKESISDQGNKDIKIELKSK
jgi:hypothetical protein